MAFKMKGSLLKHWDKDDKKQGGFSHHDQSKLGGPKNNPWGNKPGEKKHPNYPPHIKEREDAKKEEAAKKEKKVLPGQSVPFKMKGFPMHETSALYKNNKGPRGSRKYHTYGLPPVLYKADGSKIDTANIDEGQYSKKKGVGQKKHVTNVETGEKLYFKPRRKMEKGKGSYGDEQWDKE